MLLSQIVTKMLQRGPPPGFIGSFKKSGIVPSNESELRKHALLPYYKTRDFRKKIAQLYVPVIESLTTKANGRFPVFNVAQNAFDNLLSKKASGTGSASSNVRPARK